MSQAFALTKSVVISSLHPDNVISFYSEQVHHHIPFTLIWSPYPFMLTGSVVFPLARTRSATLISFILTRSAILSFHPDKVRHIIPSPWQGLLPYFFHPDKVPHFIPSPWHGLQPYLLHPDKVHHIIPSPWQGLLPQLLHPDKDHHLILSPWQGLPSYSLRPDKICYFIPLTLTRSATKLFMVCRPNTILTRSVILSLHLDKVCHFIPSPC